jgi:uncharacterized protein
MTAPLLTPQQRETLLHVLAPFADRIERVGVFGSRAAGQARANSDIDLVLYGDIDAATERRIWTLLEDTNLAVSVDVVAYARIDRPALKAHIDAVALTLFEKAELTRAGAALV